MDFRFIWAKNFNPKVKRMLKNAQNYVDTQCVEKMTPFVPVAPARFRNSGKLRNSVKIKKAGTITYTAPAVTKMHIFKEMFCKSIFFKDCTGIIDIKKFRSYFFVP